MTSILDGANQPDIDVNGDAYENWVIKRSFDMVAPICKMGLIIVLVILVVFDPAAYLRGMWSLNTQYFYLTIWHLMMASLFFAMFAATKHCHTHVARTALLSLFFFIIAGAATWFGVISWFISGDLSLFAIVLLTITSVFCFPGPLRRGIVFASAFALSLAIALTDERGTFFSSGVFVNVMAIVAITFVIDGYVMKTSRALFREKCKVEFERARADRVLYNALPVSIADELKQNRTVKAENYQQMTVLFTDIVGFTKYSSTVPPDAVIKVLNHIFSEFDALVDTHKVEKIKTIGDAYMVVGKGKAASVADLALEMMEKIAACNEVNGVNFELRIGIHIGPTIAGVIGLKRFLYDVWGDAVNTASRMESLSLPGRIHVSDEFYKELSGDYKFEDRGHMEVKGKGSMRTYFLLGH